TDVRISDPATHVENTDYNLFSEKFQNSNAAQGPTPLTYAIRIDVRDLPPRVIPFLNEWAFKPEIAAGTLTPPVADGDGFSSGPGKDGGFTLIGDANGRIAFNVFAHVVAPTPDGQPATGYVELEFVDANGNPIALPDDRYTLHIDDTAIVDPAGNKLDG